MNLVTTHSRSCARLGLAHLLSTLALVSVAGLIVPDACDAAVADGAVVSAASQPVSPEWNVEAVLQDPADTPDDDDDDDPDAQQDASSAVAAGRAIADGLDSSWRLAYRDGPLTASHSLEGHYLRGPPAITQEPCDFDDDSDDDSSLDSASTAPGPLVRASLPTFLEQDRVRARAHDTARLRAP
jgi:hypothetical protein